MPFGAERGLRGVTQVRRRHLELSHRLLQIMRCIDALEGRFAISQQLWDVQLQEVVAELKRVLGGLETAVASASAGHLGPCWSTLKPACPVHCRLQLAIQERSSGGVLCNAACAPLNRGVAGETDG